MGLFGGFRAKFTRNSKEKKKHEQVVCVSYIVSDFDSKNVEPSTVRRPRIGSENSQKNDSTNTSGILLKSKSLERLPPVLPMKPPAPLPRGSPPPLPKDPPPLLSKMPPPPIPHDLPPPLPKRQDLGEYIVVNNNDDHIDKRLSFDSNESGEEIPQDDQVVEYIEIREINTYEPIPKRPKSILKTTKKVESDDEGQYIFDNKDIENGEKTARFSDQSPLIFMTQSSSSDSGSDIKNEENGEDNFEYNIRCLKNDASLDMKKSSSFKIDSSQIEDSYRYEEDFKVNIVQHEQEMQLSFSEDELSEDFDANKNEDDYEFIGYSRHAASIFFGDDVPPKPKPRRIPLDGGDINSIEGEC